MRTLWDPTINQTQTHRLRGEFLAIRAAPKMFHQVPMVGVGPGNFVPYRETLRGLSHLEPHNLVGQMLAETGAVGGGGIGVSGRGNLGERPPGQPAASRRTDPTLRLLAGLARAGRDSTSLTFCRRNRHGQFLSVQPALAAAFCSLLAQYALRIRATVESEDEARRRSPSEYRGTLKCVALSAYIFGRDW